MRALIVYESMYGNTRAIAEAIAEGLREHGDADVVDVGSVSAEQVAHTDLLVVGGPTHVHGMSSTTSRRSAADRAHEEGSELVLEPGVPGLVGLRSWFDAMPQVRGHGTPAAAFDTRANAALLLTGRASRGIATRLTRHGYQLVTPPESFLVDKNSHLLPGELERATAWARTALGPSLGAR
ncbi:MAG: flavodoxin [Frankiales bacterium]|nr:flavodoxin [Frankiales bacterium]